MNPRAAGDAGGCAVARLQGHGADQRHEADAQDEARAARPAAAPRRATSRIRVSLDHYGRALHEAERGARSWKPTIDGLVWLAADGLRRPCRRPALLGRAEEEVRAGYARLFAELGVPIDAHDPVTLVLFPEMDAARRRARDHHRLLGHPEKVARQRDVRLLAHGGEAQGRRRAPPSSPARCCPTIRSSSSAHTLADGVRRGAR